MLSSVHIDFFLRYNVECVYIDFCTSDQTNLHYYKKHFQGRLVTLCRGGLASRPYRTVSTNHAFVGAVPRPPLQIDLQGRLVIEPPLQINLQGRLVLRTAPTNLFVGAAVVPAASIIPVCRGGSIQNRPYNTFSRKKNSNLQSKFDQNCLFLRIPSSVRVAKRPVTNVPNHVRSRV